MILIMFGRISKKLTMPSCKLPAMLVVPVVPRMFVICGLTIIRLYLIPYRAPPFILVKLTRNNITFHDQMTINVKEICEKIKTLPMGKAPGFDNVSNEHFKYANEKLYVFLSLLYSSLLIHGFFYLTV